MCTPQNVSLCICAIVNFTVSAFICHWLFFFRHFWTFKKSIARMRVTSTLRNNDGKRESISLLQILKTMVRINQRVNFTTFHYLGFSNRNFCIEINPHKNVYSLFSLIIRLPSNFTYLRAWWKSRFCGFFKFLILWVFKNHW